MKARTMRSCESSRIECCPSRQVAFYEMHYPHMQPKNLLHVPLDDEPPAFAGVVQARRKSEEMPFQPFDSTFEHA